MCSECLGKPILSTQSVGGHRVMHKKHSTEAGYRREFCTACVSVCIQSAWKECVGKFTHSPWC